MSENRYRPRILIIDDQCGLTLPTGHNRDRAAMCGKYGLLDITGDEEKRNGWKTKEEPLAEAVFIRGQKPSRASLGDTVENDLDGCLRIVQEGWDVLPGQPFWSLVLLDLCFWTGKVTTTSESDRGPGMPEGRPDDNTPTGYFGFKILRAIQERWPDLPVIVLSSMPRDSASNQFSSYGALAFLERNAEPEVLKEYLWRHGLLPDESGVIIGRSKPLLFALRQARQAAAKRDHVLLRAPTGSGKELLAGYIFNQALRHCPDYRGRARDDIPFITHNCGAMDRASNLYLAELFGVAPGLGRDIPPRPGKIELANTGHLFLDEVGTLTPAGQDSLLRAAREGDIWRLGATEPIKVDVCIISATNEDIEKRASLGDGFRPDLLYRLRRGGTVVLPSLNERREDIPGLVQHFLEEIKREGETNCKAITDETVDLLISWDWPGNINKLMDCLTIALTQNAHDVDELHPHHLKLPIKQIPSSLAMTQTQPVAPASIESVQTLVEILDAMSSFDFSRLSTPDLAGLLGRIVEHSDLFIAKYLEAVLVATKDHVTDEIKPLRAFQTAAGTKEINATVAWDNYINLLQFLKIKPGSPLEEVFRHAVQQRRRTPKGDRW